MCSYSRCSGPAPASGRPLGRSGRCQSGLRQSPAAPAGNPTLWLPGSGCFITHDTDFSCLCLLLALSLNQLAVAKSVQQAETKRK